MARPAEKARRRNSSTARLLAPIALIAVSIVLIMVISASLGESSGSGEGSGNSTAKQQTTTKKQDKPPKTYLVESGDSVSEIADRFGITVEEILRLNEGIDPQALTTGQELKLR